MIQLQKLQKVVLIKKQVPKVQILNQEHQKMAQSLHQERMKSQVLINNQAPLKNKSNFTNYLL